MGFRKTIGALKERARRLPRPARIAAGIALILGGVVGFLPVLGFWMIPAGLLVLAIDIPIAKKVLHRAVSALNQWRRNRRSN